jgi:CheY-like chemotaxis protein/nitrogen-specific signal transduction histidine kinase/HPt (histidine-containing phosphotransfer) domain-containing protein
MGGWVGTLADVTAEAGAEAAMADALNRATEASRLKSDFLANMSHEIRTPMSGVIGMTDLLLETNLDTRQRDYATTVRNSGEALLTIINDILDFSKIEAGQLEMEDIDFALRSVVDDVTDLLVGSAQVKGLEVIAVIDSDIPPVVSGDPGRLRQVLTNLIGNAIKFTDDGEVVVRVSKIKVVGSDTLLHFEVTDTGVGIAPEKLDAIFQPFVQADSSTSRRHGGTGLGLAISAQLVSLMGGERGVVSRLGRGSTFWFTVRVHAETKRANNSRLPPDAGPAALIVDDDSTVLAEVAPLYAASAHSRELGRLLLAEDNLINQKVALAMLADSGYQVDTVLDGGAAVRAINTRHYDAVLMDCQMPELNGYEATKTIRAMTGPNGRIPIIAMTAGARQEDKAHCLAVGMDCYLAKPVSKDALLAMLARWVPEFAAVESAPVDPPARPEARSTSSVLDSEIVGRLERLGEAAGEDLVGQLAVLFQADASGHLLLLRQALAATDATAAGLSAHSMKGASANLGATHLARLCGELEERSVMGNLSGASALIDAIETELDRVHAALGALAPAP